MELGLSYRDCLIVYQNGKAVRMRATKLTVKNGEKYAIIYDGEAVIAVVPLDAIKTILFCDIADTQEIVDAINGVGVEEEIESGEVESALPYKEKDTLCDTCLHLQECIENGNALDVTACCDSRKHYIKALGADCSGFGEYFYSHEIAKADK